jgi:hypothetical protein
MVKANHMRYRIYVVILLIFLSFTSCKSYDFACEDTYRGNSFRVAKVTDWQRNVIFNVQFLESKVSSNWRNLFSVTDPDSDFSTCFSFEVHHSDNLLSVRLFHTNAESLDSGKTWNVTEK